MRGDIREIEQPPRADQIVAGAWLKHHSFDRTGLFYQHRIDTNIPGKKVARAVKYLIREAKVKPLALKQAEVKKHFLSPCTIPCSVSIHCEDMNPKACMVVIDLLK